MKNTKIDVYNSLIKEIQFKISNLKSDVNSVIVSRDNETKSSFGDKHETSRSRIEMELQLYRKQLSIFNNYFQFVKGININKIYKKAEMGALIYTNSKTFFISVSFGKFLVNKQNIYAISLKSPVGKLLKGKVVGSNFTFNNNVFKIIEIL